MRQLSEYSAAADGNRTLDEAMDEVRREVEVRRRIYDRWINEGKLSRTEATDRMCRMLSALKMLIELDAVNMQLDAARKQNNALGTANDEYRVALAATEARLDILLHERAGSMPGNDMLSVLDGVAQQA